MSTQPRILVIDDDENVRYVMKINLVRAGYDVELAENGAEAIEKAKKKHYNLSLIDIKLPDILGTELLRLLHADYPKMIKIIVTGFPTMENAVKALNEGADGFILKPVDINKLLSMVKKHLEIQLEDQKYSVAKVEEFIETRVKELESLLKYHKPIGQE